MKLRRILTENGPEIEALKPNTSEEWVALSQLDTTDITRRFAVENNLSTCLLSVLALGPDGWEMLSEKLNACEATTEIFDVDLMLPFQPVSFRDFLLFEQHFIDASRGFVKRFLPRKYKAIAAYEFLTRQTFPKLKPPAIWYKQPLYYFGNHLNFITSGDVIDKPDYTNALDYELELGAILAAPLLDATAEEATQAIGGYVVLNDLSARDVQFSEMHSGFGPQKAKHFQNAMSPIVVTADEINHRVNNLSASVTFNGIKSILSSTKAMQYSLGEAIAYASKGEQLHVGELFGSGTLPGGSGMENGYWLQDGTVLNLTINQVGEISNRIVFN